MTPGKDGIAEQEELMLVEMTVKGIAQDPITLMQILILQEKEGDRLLRIWIGTFEAEAILRELEHIPAPRPMTHDLMRNIILELHATITRVVITDLRENTYFAEITLEHPGGITEVDARPSDAIALCVRFRVPLFAHERVFQKLSGVESEVEARDESERLKRWLEKLKPEDFGKYKM